MTKATASLGGSRKAINKQRKQICRKKQEKGADRGEPPAPGKEGEEEEGAFQPVILLPLFTGMSMSDLGSQETSVVPALAFPRQACSNGHKRPPETEIRQDSQFLPTSSPHCGSKQFILPPGLFFLRCKLG